MVVWTVVLGLWIVSFAIFETYALKTGKIPSLSMFTWRVFKAWPPIAVLFGMLIGGLTVHFFWHWCPP